MKILLADDHALIRAGLRHELVELDDSVQFVDAWDANSMVQMFSSHDDLDLALVDLGMPGMDGARTIAALREDFPAVPLVVVSGADPAVDARSVMRAGAAGFIPKSAISKVMLQAIRLVLAGGQYLPPESVLLREVEPSRQDASDAPATPPQLGAGPAQRSHLDLLSQRQREVFALLAEGLSNKMIARRLNVTEGTVKNHVATIFDVLHVHNRVSAVLEARRHSGDEES